MLQRLAVRLRAAADHASPRSGSAEGAAVCGYVGGRRLGVGVPTLALVARLAEGVEYAFEGREVAFVGCRGECLLFAVVAGNHDRVDAAHRGRASSTSDGGASLRAVIVVSIVLILFHLA